MRVKRIKKAAPRSTPPQETKTVKKEEAPAQDAGAETENAVNGTNMNVKDKEDFSKANEEKRKATDTPVGIKACKKQKDEKKDEEKTMEAPEESTSKDAETNDDDGGVKPPRRYVGNIPVGWG